MIKVDYGAHYIQKLAKRYEISDKSLREGLPGSLQSSELEIGLIGYAITGDFKSHRFRLQDER
jgi:hypothetical protein